jgi:hypothetical protein
MRRFDFVELVPLFGSNVFVDFLVDCGTESGFAAIVAGRLKALNQAITEDQNLGPGFMIGHSYFCGNGVALTEKGYKQAIRHEVMPLLQEYWFDDKERAEDWADKLGASFEQA